MRTKVLYVLHNHPALYPGGAESYAVELFEALRSSPDFEPLLVARIGSTEKVERSSHPGAPFSSADGEPDQYFLFTEKGSFDFFKMTSRDKSLYSTYFAEFLEAQRPEIVHFQHTLFIGYDLISQVRRQLGDVPILYTLHEYLPICHRDGQMLRTSGELCREASPRRCNECFPDIPPQHFFLRERFIKTHLDQVDMFLAPSRFLLERYADWGIPRERIRVEDYGRRQAHRAEEASTAGRAPRNRLGFFGQINQYKGVALLLEAMGVLDREGVDAHLWLNGANLEFQPEDFQARFAELIERTESGAGNVTFRGAYDHADLPKLMADVDWVVVPSLWWENSPLVIQEAFMHGRPVICSDIGGMAEKVADGVSGIHFRAGDALGLAEAIRTAVTEPGLWERLRDGIPEVYGVEAHVESLRRTYSDLLAGRTVAEPEPQSAR